jgi:hypothetical protein
MTDDKRRSDPRFVLKLHLAGRLEQRLLNLETDNVSMGGVFLKTEERWPVGTKLELIFDRDEGVCNSAAVVVHQQAEGMGLAFVDPSPQFRAALRRIVDAAVEQNAPYISRRGQPRVAGRIALIEHCDGKSRVMYTENLSEGGAYVIGQTLRELGSSFALTLSEHGLFDCDARIVRRDGKSAGIMFATTTPLFNAALRRILDAFVGVH